MTRHGPALIAVLAEIPHFHQAQAKPYPLPALLARAVAAICCGYRRYGARAQGARHYGAELMQALGCTRWKRPCAATLHTIFRDVDKQMVAAPLGAWASQVMASATASDD